MDQIRVYTKFQSEERKMPFIYIGLSAEKSKLCTHIKHESVHFKRMRERTKKKNKIKACIYINNRY